MQIEEGKFYRTRDGQKVGPMRRNDSDSYPWAGEVSGIVRCFTLRGDWDNEQSNAPFDLIAEWTDPAPEPAKAGLPDAMVFLGEENFRCEVNLDNGRVRLAVTYDDDLVGYPFTPERARALAAALTAYADQAEAGE